MKGPGGRLKFDIRRVWECPLCHRRELTSGEVVNHACTCSSKPPDAPSVWMRLIEPKPARRPPAIPAQQPVAEVAAGILLSAEPPNTDPSEQQRAP